MYRQHSQTEIVCQSNKKNEMKICQSFHFVFARLKKRRTMNQQHLQTYYTRERLFNDRFPLSIVAVLAVIQMFTTFGIVALEIGHILINIRLTNLYVGIWASVPFTILWISMFAAGKSFIENKNLLINFIDF